MPEKNKKILKVFILLLVFGVLFGILIKILFYPDPQENMIGKVNVDQVAPPANKSPETFMQSIQEKAKENQKKYDSSLDEFAEKKWKKIFSKQNDLNAEYLVDNVKILDRKVEKDSSGSSIFKIKFRLKTDDSGKIYEDFYYMLLSEYAKETLKLTSLKANVFLSEEIIIENINKEGFAQITKIQK